MGKTEYYSDPIQITFEDKNLCQYYNEKPNKAISNACQEELQSKRAFTSSQTLTKSYGTLTNTPIWSQNDLKSLDLYKVKTNAKYTETLDLVNSEKGENLHFRNIEFDDSRENFRLFFDFNGDFNEDFTLIFNQKYLSIHDQGWCRCCKRVMKLDLEYSKKSTIFNYKQVQIQTRIICQKGHLLVWGKSVGIPRTLKFDVSGNTFEVTIPLKC